MQFVKLRTGIRVNEAANAADKIALAYQQEPMLLGNPDLSGIITKIVALGDQITSLIKQQTAFSVQDEKDRIRDKYLRDLGKAIHGYAAIPVEPMKSAAIAVAEVFDRFGTSIADESYAIESVSINALTGQLDVPAIREKINLLNGVGQLIDSLKMAQTDFNIAYVAYESMVADKKEAATASSVKPKLISIINNELVIYLKTMTMLKPDQFGSFAAVVNQIIVHTNDDFDRRSSNDQPVVGE